MATTPGDFMQRILQQLRGSGVAVGDNDNVWEEEEPNEQDFGPTRRRRGLSLDA